MPREKAAGVSLRERMGEAVSEPRIELAEYRISSARRRFHRYMKHGMFVLVECVTSHEFRW